MERTYQVKVKKPIREQPAITEILNHYNDTILEEAQLLVAQRGATAHAKPESLVIKCISNQEAIELREELMHVIQKHNTDAWSQLRGTQLNNTRWTAFCCQIYDEFCPRPFRSNLKHQRTPSLVNEKESDEAGAKREKTDGAKKDAKLTIRYKKNPALTVFFHANAKLFLGIELFTTQQTDEDTIHKITFMNSKILTLFKSKLRSMNYSDEAFKFEDITIITQAEEQIQVIFQNIKNKKL